jgi:hypothetical protein
MCVRVRACVGGGGDEGQAEPEHGTPPKRNEVGQEDFFRGLYMRLLVTFNRTPQQTHVESRLFTTGDRTMQFL